MSSWSWPKVTISTDTSERVSAISPCIISASRSTDIPAFYDAWLMRRLETGYCRWINPWSGRSTYVSLHAARLFVFWSKNPQPFIPYLGEFRKRKLNYYFHYTLNDYGPEGLERGLPPLPARIETFKRLAGLIGPERVLWRFDPLLCTNTLTAQRLLDRIASIGAALAGSTERLTVSFLSCYTKVTRNLKNAGITIEPWSVERKAAFAGELSKLARELRLCLVTCAEEADYGYLGIPHGKCIDDALIERLFGSDEDLVKFLEEKRRGARTGCLKDGGQRPFCGCIPSKDIGGYNTCGHQCIYCYANSTPRRGMENSRLVGTDSDAIGL